MWHVNDLGTFLARMQFWYTEKKFLKTQFNNWISFIGMVCLDMWREAC